MIRGWGALTLGVATFACSETEECARLNVAVEQSERALTDVQLRAAMKPRVEKRFHESKEEAQKILAAYWLDKPESTLTETFEQRAAKFEGVDVERTTRQTQEGVPQDPKVFDTVWVFRIAPRPLRDVFGLLDALAGSPPLTNLTLFSREDDGGYRLELTRLSLPEAPMDAQPVALPPLPEIDDIPRQLGFCGARKMRSRLAEIESEIERLGDDAQATTSLMPESATWQGKGVRAEQRATLERGGRAVLAKFLMGVVETPVRLKAVGQDRDAIVVEVRGSKGRVERQLASLSPELRAAMTDLPSPADDLQRYAIANPAFEAMKGPGTGGTEGEGLGGLPSPGEMEKAFREAQGHDQHEH